MENDILQSLRAMAWERAKGELKSMLQTFYPDYGNGGEVVYGKFNDLDECIKEFIEKVEDEIGI